MNVHDIIAVYDRLFLLELAGSMHVMNVLCPCGTLYCDASCIEGSL